MRTLVRQCHEACPLLHSDTHKNPRRIEEAVRGGLETSCERQPTKWRRSHRLGHKSSGRVPCAVGCLQGTTRHSPPQEVSFRSWLETTKPFARKWPFSTIFFVTLAGHTPQTPRPADVETATAQGPRGVKKPGISPATGRKARSPSFQGGGDSGREGGKGSTGAARQGERGVYVQF